MQLGASIFAFAITLFQASRKYFGILLPFCGILFIIWRGRREKVVELVRCNLYQPRGFYSPSGLGAVCGQRMRLRGLSFRLLWSIDQEEL